MKIVKIAALSAVLCLAASSAFAEVQITMQGGRVSIVAKDATLRQILTEWARVGQTKIVNVERVPGGPMSIELTNVPEQLALDTLLRTLSGYLAAPRREPDANLSQYDRIVVMPTIAAARPAATASAPPAPVFNQPPMPQPPAEADADEPITAAPGQNPNRGPVFNAFPQPQVVNPQPVQAPQPVFGSTIGAPASTPGAPAPIGVAVPGMIVQPPQQPGQPGTIQTPGQPVRRPGGQS